MVVRAVARGELDRAPSTDRIVRLPLDLLRHDLMMRVAADADADADADDTIIEIVDRVRLPLLRVDTGTGPDRG